MLLFLYIITHSLKRHNSYIVIKIQNNLERHINHNIMSHKQNGYEK